MQVIKVCAVVLVFVAVATAVPGVQKCASAKKPADEDVIISGCDKPPCILKRRTNVDIEFHFKTDSEVKSLRNTVFARIAGLPLPFIGVDDTDACVNIESADGTKKGCPLVAGEKYVYKNVIKVLPIYPKVSPTVHWALEIPGTKDLFCMEIPARITG